jgi:putative PIN family toxin of toxin-antitoxin system
MIEMIRIVIDTNLIIAGRYNPGSASNQIIDLCLDKKLQAVYTDGLKKENMFILEKFSPSAEYLEKIKRFYTVSIRVIPNTKIDICSDCSDNKYFEAALAGQVQYIITNDRHLLDHDGYIARVLRPREFLKNLKVV